MERGCWCGQATLACVPEPAAAVDAVGVVDPDDDVEPLVVAPEAVLLPVEASPDVWVADSEACEESAPWALSVSCSDEPGAVEAPEVRLSVA